MLRENNMCRWWSACVHYYLGSSLFLCVNFLVLANSLSPSLQRRHIHSLCHDQERLALLHFKRSFLVDCRASASDFARPKVDSWWDDSSTNGDMHNRTTSISDCCKWDGVECNDETGHVIGLDLSSSCLFGSFPRNTTLFGLNHLQVLDLSENNFNYSLIPSAVAQLSKLTRLVLSYSSFTGQIPMEISKLPSLSILDLSNNNGLEFQNDFSFKMFVGNLTHLTYLDLDYVHIPSVVPVILTNMTSLNFLSLEFCNLYGDFPVGIFQLPKLVVLDLGDNINLKGFLPEFSDNSPLTQLGLYITSFSGKLPFTIGKLSKLTVLNLGYTNFIGHVPSSISNLTKLTFLDLAQAKFQGSLPLPILNLTQLTVLYLSHLDVRIEMMNCWLRKLNKLEKLLLSDGILSDEIPQAIANHTKLIGLDVSSNQLTGTLPPCLANLTELYYLDIRNNEFQGPAIPLWISQLFNLGILFLSSKGSIAKFDPLIKLINLKYLYLTGVNLVFPSMASTNSSLPKFQNLRLESCNLTEFPEVLHFQDELELLTLQQNNIAGTIPTWLVNTTAESLKVFDLRGNLLTGFEQPEASLPWKNLEIFYISNNNFEGLLPLPPKSLQIYDASQNHFYGALPMPICKSSSLTYLDLSVNNLSGHIPACISTHLSSSLQVLNLRGNHLNGTIPHTFLKACNLKMINLSENQLEGELPKSLINCRVIEVLDVGKNNLSGIFPSWLGKLPNLQVLVLRHNNFHGDIPTPDSDIQFKSLRMIDLSNNFYMGHLPYMYIQNWHAMRDTTEDYPDSSQSDIGIFVQAANIYYLAVDEPYYYEITITNKGTERLIPRIWKLFRAVDFSSNNFTGEIPDILGSLRGLQTLNLSKNHLTGSIPSSLADMIDLEVLDLSQNMLTRKIPQQLSKITSLEIFNVSHNRLKGPIPQGNQFNTFDNSSFDGNLAVCGPPLPNECGHTSLVPREQMNNDGTKIDTKLIDWIIRLLGCVSGCIVGFIIGKIFITDRYHDWFMDTFGGKRMSKRRARSSAPSRRRN